ncbi:indoleamine 2,3-dioxygenase family protein [Niveomyces insectorum RCEF 264]|uniref:Indoleamine 2,3-dioxygenase family protein n=1 Tax=Niveomyces insectorum RCEF 264 TaxID=1081102 RepID=A0A168AHP0_9HYPO|nr:indoleamine 2,3-dioxygenase family protein [Niveomyces insectorum RCEF 264]
MEQFGLSANGFLPATLPLARLPDPYYDPWESVIHRLPSLLQGRLLRDEVRRLAILSTEKLHTEEEWRRAHLILCFLAHAYIWGGETVADVLPPCLTVPLLATAAHLELPPVGTYAALNLWNFTTTTTTTTTTDEEASIPFDDLDRLQALHTFTGTASESWFYVVSVAIECRGAALVPVLLGALAAARARDYAATELADDAFPAAARALADFRSKHLAIVTRYIIVPARQQAALALASSSSSSSLAPSSSPGLQLTGTGGTDLLPFLKQSRDETLRAAFPDKAGRFVDMNNGRDQHILRSITATPSCFASTAMPSFIPYHPGPYGPFNPNAAAAAYQANGTFPTSPAHLALPVQHGHHGHHGHHGQMYVPYTHADMRKADAARRLEQLREDMRQTRREVEALHGRVSEVGVQLQGLTAAVDGHVKKYVKKYVKK